jgi:hypothetical protein
VREKYVVKWVLCNQFMALNDGNGGNGLEVLEGGSIAVVVDSRQEVLVKVLVGCEARCFPVK